MQNVAIVQTGAARENVLDGKFQRCIRMEARSGRGCAEVLG